MEDGEYRSDGDFHASLHTDRAENTEEPGHKPELSLVEAAAIGACGGLFLFGTAVFVWRLYVHVSKTRGLKLALIIFAVLCLFEQ